MSSNSDLLDHYVERYNAGDLDAVMDLYADVGLALLGVLAAFVSPSVTSARSSASLAQRTRNVNL